MTAFNHLLDLREQKKKKHFEGLHKREKEDDFLKKLLVLSGCEATNEQRPECICSYSIVSRFKHYKRWLLHIINFMKEKQFTSTAGFVYAVQIMIQWSKQFCNRYVRGTTQSHCPITLGFKAERWITKNLSLQSLLYILLPDKTLLLFIADHEVFFA